jgi:ribosomal protein S15P/S13E
MEARIDKVKKEIAATNQLLLAARIDSETNPQDHIARAKVQHYENEIARLVDYRKTLVTALAGVATQTQGILRERSSETICKRIVGIKL